MTELTCTEQLAVAREEFFYARINAGVGWFFSAALLLYCMHRIFKREERLIDGYKTKEDEHL